MSGHSTNLRVDTMLAVAGLLVSVISLAIPIVERMADQARVCFYFKERVDGDVAPEAAEKVMHKETRDLTAKRWAELWIFNPGPAAAERVDFRVKVGKGSGIFLDVYEPSAALPISGMGSVEGHTTKGIAESSTPRRTVPTDPDEEPVPRPALGPMPPGTTLYCVIGYQGEGDPEAAVTVDSAPAVRVYRMDDLTKRSHISDISPFAMTLLVIIVASLAVRLMRRGVIERREAKTLRTPDMPSPPG